METFFALLIISGIAGIGVWMAKRKNEFEAPGPLPLPMPEPIPVLPQEIDPNDYRTWPTGDKVWDVCRAIAIAEGYNQPGAVPQRLCNPGDISDGATTYGSEAHSGSNVTHFPSHQIGWNWLYTKIRNAVTGRSTVYSPQMSWNQFAQKYAGSWQNWVTHVTRELDVKPTDKVGDYFV